MQKKYLTVSTLAGGMLLAGSALAAPTPLEVKYTPAELLAGKISDGRLSAIFKANPAPQSLSLIDTDDPTCKLVFKNGDSIAWEKKPSEQDESGCTKLWEGQPSRVKFDIADGTDTKAYTVTFTFELSEDAPAPTIIKNQGLSFKDVTLPTNGALYFLVPRAGKNRSEWMRVTAENGSFEIPAELRSKKEITAYANFDAKGKSDTWTGIDLKLSTAGTNEQKGDEEDTKTVTSDPKHDDFCNDNKVPADEGRRYVVCLDLFADVDDETADGTGAAFVFKPETRGHILLPNRAVVVRVRHARGGKVTISIDGKRGLSKGIVDDQTPKANGDKTAGHAGTPKQPALSPDVVTEWSFGPQLPGQTDIKVVLEKGGRTSTYRTEATVEELHIGAFRLGLGPVFKGAVERSYEAKVMPGSQQAQIVGKTSGYTDIELVLGFAPYVFDYYARGGRAQISRRTSYIAPYFGLGLVNANENAFELLKSFHIGGELELSPGFSIAGTFVLRRVTRLAPGYEVGMPVSGADVPTTTGYNWGLGLIANFSPDFFKIATQSGSSFFK